jgi:translation initiation factor IF-2
MLQALMKMVYDLPRLDGVSMHVRTTEVGGVRDADLAQMGGSGQPACVLVYGDVKDTAHMDVPAHIQIHRFNVLYHGIEALKKTLVDALPKIKKTRITATAECTQTFRASQSGKNGNAGGMTVSNGTLLADHLTFRVTRRSNHKAKLDEERKVVYEGQLKELRRFKELVPSVEAGMECGCILFDEFAFRTGDILEQVEEYEEERDVEEEFSLATQRESAMRQMVDQEEQQSSEDPSASS